MSDYKKSGVDLSQAEKINKIIGKYTKKTHNASVLESHGSFGGSFEFDPDSDNPVLVNSVDGVGTKLDVAVRAGRHNTIGYDLVNHCINDIATQGAEPLYFMDYIVYTELKTEVIEEIIQGLSGACEQSEIPLIGGETAQMPGYYEPGKYDIIGFITGYYDKNKLITGEDICAGDVVIGLSSNGLHTNGYSLARKVLFQDKGYEPSKELPKLGSTLGEALLLPHRNYLEITREAKKELNLKGIAHITGGGIKGNLSRVMPDGLTAFIDKGTWEPPIIFNIIQKEGDIATEEMFKVFNMGIGYVYIIPREQVADCLKLCKDLGIPAGIIGNVEKGDEKVGWK